MSNLPKPKILVIEDNADTRKFLSTVLAKDFEVSCAENGVVGVDLAKTLKPDLILLDIMMPVLNGFDTCSLLRKEENTKKIPIIFLSAKNTSVDITHGLDLGADDYLSKPFDYKELIARIRVRLREKQSWKNEPKTISVGELKLILDTRDTYYAGKNIVLTQTEFDILLILLQNPNVVVSREEIISKVWRTADATAAQKRTIDVHIRALRKKIPELTKYVLSVYGVGYKFTQ